MVDNQAPTCESCLAVRMSAWGWSALDIGVRLQWSTARVRATLKKAGR